MHRCLPRRRKTVFCQRHSANLQKSTIWLHRLAKRSRLRHGKRLRQRHLSILLWQRLRTMVYRRLARHTKLHTLQLGNRNDLPQTNAVDRQKQKYEDDPQPQNGPPHGRHYKRQHRCPMEDRPISNTIRANKRSVGPTACSKSPKTPIKR